MQDSCNYYFLLLYLTHFLGEKGSTFTFYLFSGCWIYWRKMAEKVHAFEEVAKHNKREDCWLIISGKVYDVTPFLDEHPGGDEVMLTSTGKDATADFDDVGHSNDAQEKMKEFYIGEIDKSTIPVKQHDTPPPTTASSTANRDSGDSSKILLYIVPLLILGVAFLLRFYSKKE